MCLDAQVLCGLEAGNRSNQLNKMLFCERPFFAQIEQQNSMIMNDSELLFFLNTTRPLLY